MLVPPDGVLPDNDAERLYRILRRFRELPEEMTIKEALQNVLSSESLLFHQEQLESEGPEWLDTLDDDVFVRKLAHLFAMPGRAVAQLRNVLGSDEDELTWHLQWEQPVRRAIAQTLDLQSPISTVVSCCGAEDLAYLQASAFVLRRARIEPRLQFDQVRELRKRLGVFVTEVDRAEDIPPVLARFILRQLGLIDVALRDYSVRGAAALDDAFAHAVGATIINQVVRETVRDEDSPGNKWLDRFKTYIGAVGIAAGTFTTLLALPTAAQTAAEVFWPPAIEQEATETPVSAVELPAPAATDSVP